MRYYKTEPAEQETTINILYKEQIIRIYSSRVETIEKLTKKIGNLTIDIKEAKLIGAELVGKYNLQILKE